MMSQSHRTARNVSIVSLASLGQIVIQFLFQRVLARIYGAEADADALAAALALPTMFAAIVTGSLGYVLVPELVAKFKSQQTLREGWRLASFVGIVTGAASIAFSVVLWGAAQPLCGWLYGDLEASQLQLIARLLKILSIQVVLTGLISWAQAVHHSRHSFLLPAVGGVLGTGLSLALAQQYGVEGIVALAWAINAGSLVSVLIHIVPLLSRLGTPDVDFSNMIKLCRLFWPLLLGAAFMRIDPLVDRVLAAKLAVLDPGAIAYINYAQRILVALLAIGTSSLSVVAFPQLAQRLEGEGQVGFAAHFSIAFRRLLLMVVPIAIGFSMFSIRIVSDLLEQGQFTQQDSRVVGWLIVAMMGMFVGASCGELLARGYYVLGDTITPTVVGAVSVALGLALKLLLFQFVGIWGIALGVSGYCLISAMAMGYFLVRRVQSRMFEGCGLFLLHAIVGTIIACGICFLIYQVPGASTWVAAPIGALSYFAALLSMRNSDALQSVAAMKSKLELLRR
jgi:putative peptidoglycan lipid II flippase